MKCRYYPETDSLYIDLVDRPSAEAEEVRSGVALDFDADGNLVGIGIDHAGFTHPQPLPAREGSKCGSGNAEAERRMIVRDRR